MGITVDPNVGLSQAYIDKMNLDLAKAKIDFQKYQQAAKKAKKEYELAELHFKDLKEYCQHLKITYLQVSDLFNYITTLITQAANVGKNIRYSYGALQIITKFLKCLCEKVESLKLMVNNLLGVIEATGSELLNSDKATLVTDLRAMETAIKESTTIITKAIEALIDLYRCLIELRYMIGDVAEKDQSDNVLAKDPCKNSVSVNLELEYGLIRDLEQLLEILKCEYKAGINVKAEACEEMSTQSGNADEVQELKDCCWPQDNCEGDPPKVKSCEETLMEPRFCTSENEGGLGFKSDFFVKNITGAKDEADKLTKYKKCVWDFFEKKKAAALANKASIEKSLEAAKEAKKLCES